MPDIQDYEGKELGETCVVHLKRYPFYERFWSLNVIAIIYVLLSIGGEFHWECPFYALFHVPCPGCGITRGFICLMSGNIYGAFNHNPLIIPFVVIWLMSMMLFVYDLITLKSHLNNLYVNVNEYLSKHQVVTLVIIALGLSPWVYRLLRC